MRTAVRAVACSFVLALGLSGEAAANASQQAGPALLALFDADPLELERVVKRFGDRAILQLLAPANDTALRLAAVRASPWLRAPERALAPLSELAAGNDSELAPAAARAAALIAAGLSAARLAERECLPDELTPALTRLRALGERESAARHIRAYAWLAAEQLSSAGVPLPVAE